MDQADDFVHHGEIIPPGESTTRVARVARMFRQAAGVVKRKVCEQGPAAIVLAAPLAAACYFNPLNDPDILTSVSVGLMATALTGANLLYRPVKAASAGFVAYELLQSKGMISTTTHSELAIGLGFVAAAAALGLALDVRRPVGLVAAGVLGYLAITTPLEDHRREPSVPLHAPALSTPYKYKV